ncbi:uncharacterized protein LOC134059878 isoform X2 [Sardina pilchardus]|uniref:uncharacterized protein LOC134059878 isoform X2 n=1 Tax=Sardina pilchardus TaxID=27697 RepID=UPI002E123D88
MHCSQARLKVGKFAQTLTVTIAWVETTTFGQAGRSSPTFSLVSMKSDQSMNMPLSFTTESDPSSSQYGTGPGGLPCADCQKEAKPTCLTYCGIHAKKHKTCSELQSYKTSTKKKHQQTLVERLTKECCQIKSGSPDLYQLKTKKEYVSGDETVRRWTFGQRDDSKKNRTIMLVGQTGTGKTTLINSMINYIVGVKKEDNIWFQISEETEYDQTKSKTTCLTVYEVFIKERPISFSILDMPGFGDTEEGLVSDEMIAKRLYTLFSSHEGIYSIDAIGIVVKDSLACLDDKQLYMFDAIQSLFGKNVGGNMVVFITHAEEIFHYNVFAAIDKCNISVAKNDRNQPIHFLFDNFQSDRSQVKNDSVYDAKWDLGQRSTDEFMSWLNSTTTQNLRITEKVLRDRLTLDNLVKSINKSNAQIESKRQELKKIENVMKTMEAEKDITIKVEKKFKRKIEIFQTSIFGNEAMCCQKCEENCHLGCWWITDLKSCKAMSGGKCTVCTGRCSSDKHVKSKEMYISETKTVTEIEGGKKARYEIEYSKVESKKTEVEAELHNEEKMKSKLLDETYDHISKLEDFALKQLSVFTLVHLDFLIEQMKKMETDNTEKVKILEDKMKSQVDVSSRKALRYYRCNKSQS